jgi:hypothetical protein
MEAKLPLRRCPGWNYQTSCLKARSCAIRRPRLHFEFRSRERRRAFSFHVAGDDRVGHVRHQLRLTDTSARSVRVLALPEYSQRMHTIPRYRSIYPPNQRKQPGRTIPQHANSDHC